MKSHQKIFVKKLLLQALAYFLCLGLGVLLNALFDKQGNMFYAPAFSAIFSGIVYYRWMLKEKRFGSDTSFTFLFRKSSFLGSAVDLHRLRDFSRQCCSFRKIQEFAAE